MLPVPRTLTAAIGGVMVMGGVALAVATGVQNGSFESGLSDWNASIVHNGVYTPVTGDCGGAPPEDLCVVSGDDSFSVTDGVYSRSEVVSPIDGTKMVRMGGPFLSNSVHQSLDKYVLRQTFVVDAANPVLQLNYNVYTWDYSGFDDLTFKVKLTDENGDVITSQHQGSFGPGGDIHLKTTGWRPTHIDLSGYEGQQVHLQIISGGTKDNLYGFWSYVDAGMVPAPPVGTPTAHPVNAPGGGTVPIDSFTDDGSGLTWLTIPHSVQQTFPGPNHCMPLTLDVPINPGSGTVSDVHLVMSPGGSVNMTDNGNGTWRADIPCVNQSTDLFLSYKLTEGTTTQSFSVPLGGLVLIDPAGVVYDKAAHDAAVGAGQSEAAALASSAITGAQVRLQRCTSASGGCGNVLSGDPGISPNVNPEVTHADGRFQWDVSGGFYRVVVTKAGFDTATSAIRTIPPPVTDLNIPMTRPGSGGGGGGEQQQQQQQQVTQSGTTTTQGTPVKKAACAGLKGKKLKACKDKQKLKAALAKCGKLKGKKRAACQKKVKALAKCDKLKGKKRAACRRQATHGRKH